MKKCEIILLVLGVGFAFAEITPVVKNENPVTEKDLSVLEIVTYTDELENREKSDEVLKAEIPDNLNEAASILMQRMESNECEKAIEFEETINTDALVANDPVVNEVLDVNNLNWDGYHNVEDDYVPMQESDFNYKDLMDSDPNEIMDTAAGFVPIPILKRRQKPRRQFVSRRYFRRPTYNPYRRFYYHPYYRYYYPGSLRYY